MTGLTDYLRAHLADCAAAGGQVPFTVLELARVAGEHFAPKAVSTVMARAAVEELVREGAAQLVESEEGEGWIYAEQAAVKQGSLFV